MKWNIDETSTLNENFILWFHRYLISLLIQSWYLCQKSLVNLTCFVSLDPNLHKINKNNETRLGQWLIPQHTLQQEDEVVGIRTVLHLLALGPEGASSGWAKIWEDESEWERRWWQWRYSVKWWHEKDVAQAFLRCVRCNTFWAKNSVTPSKEFMWHLIKYKWKSDETPTETGLSYLKLQTQVDKACMYTCIYKR
jgi:hypothetical protein